MFQFILFDLDGTLTDPKEGITKSVQFALARYGITEPNLTKLEPFIGPPLKGSFMEFYGMTEADAETAIVHYRERFKPIGIFENKVYPGIREMLHNLKQAGKILAVASSKPQPFVEQILEHFELKEYFDVVVGSKLDGSRSSKEEVVEEALARLGESGQEITHDNCVMVGDRKFDVFGGQEFDLTTVAVSYGYAVKGELKAAGAEYIVKTVRQLEKLLLQENPAAKMTLEKMTLEGKRNPSSECQTSAFQKTLHVLVPLAGYYIGYNVCYMLFIALVQLGSQSSSSIEILLRDNSVLLVNGIRICSMLAGAAAIYPMFRKEKGKLLNGQEQKGLLTVGLLAISSALGMNILFGLLRITSMSAEYERVMQDQYMIPIPQGLLLYGIMAPLVEEMLFRGIIYNRLKRYFSVPVALFTSAVLFGGYHGNLVQGLYGFLLGCLIAYVYEQRGSFITPVLFHSLANCSVFLITYQPDIMKNFNTWINFLIFTIISISSLYIITKRGKIS